jgi:hypothetical protein
LEANNLLSAGLQVRVLDHNPSVEERRQLYVDSDIENCGSGLPAFSMDAFPELKAVQDKQIEAFIMLQQETNQGTPTEIL